MKKILNAGLLLGLVVAVWDFVYGFAGLYRSAAGGGIFLLVVILIQIAGLICGLKQTVKDGRGYGGQVLAGILICLVAGVVIVIASFAFTAVFTDVFDVAAELQADSWAQAGMSDLDIEATLAKTEFMRTPWFQAMMGFVGSMITGTVFSLIIAAFVRVRNLPT
jgi:hypothetical protein